MQVDSKGTIRLNISEISDELYDALLKEFAAVAEANGIELDHCHWVVEAYRDAETFEEDLIRKELKDIESKSLQGIF